MLRKLDYDTLRVIADVGADSLRISLEGELDLACADLVLALADVEISSLATVTIDISGLSFCDSAGLRALIRLRTAHQHDGRTVEIVGARPNVRRVTAILREDHHLAS